MYKGMINGKSPVSGKRTKFESKKSEYIDTILEEEDDLDLVKSRKKLTEIDEDSSKEALEKEIADIKVLLEKTREEITKAKCPYSENTAPEKSKNKTKAAGKKPDLQQTAEIDEETHRNIDEELKEVGQAAGSSDISEAKHNDSSPLEKTIIKKRITLPAAQPGAMTSVIKD